MFLMIAGLTPDGPRKGVYMSYMLNKIMLGPHFDKYSVFNNKHEPSKSIENLAKINIFVGANNSGKSRFMRSIASERQLLCMPDIAIDEINSIRQELGNQIISFMVTHRYDDMGGMKALLRTFVNGYNTILEASPLFEDVKSVFGWIYGPNAISYQVQNTHSQNLDKRVLEELHKLVTPIKNKFDAYNAKLPGEIKFQKMYMPAARGLRKYGEDIFRLRTISEYFEFEGDNREKYLAPAVFTGLDLYNEVTGLLLGDLKQRKLIEEFQIFLSRNFFGGRPIAIIPRQGKDVIFVKIGDEQEFPIHDLGDGIHQIIVLTFPLFKHKEEDLLVFIEEPEMFMHPGLQRIFLNTLFLFKNHQFFFTTHSNHFLDLTLDYEDISIYAFNKKLDDQQSTIPTFEVSNVSHASNRPLELLGVRNSSVLLTNCTIWVEGITDRKYLQHYLEMYQKEMQLSGEIKNLQEDTHYSFVEYKGANITHWSFLDAECSINVDRLCGKLFLITDKDSAGEKSKKERHEKLKLKLGDRYYCLKVREIENLLKPEILKKIIREYEKEEIEIEPFSHADYKSQPLGEYIEKKLLKGQKKRSGGYAAASGTISQKIDFCEKAISHIKVFDDLSSEAQRLTKKIAEFIVNRNA
jgi:hypothetical protein